MSPALSLAKENAKLSLATRVIKTASYTENEGGLIGQFSYHWNSYMRGEPGAFVSLNNFMRELSKLPPAERTLSEMLDERVMNINKGQPKAVRALNAIGLREGQLHGTGGWRDASNDGLG